jgi:hypothetical protein
MSGPGGWVKTQAGERTWGRMWHSRPVNDLENVEVPEAYPELYIPNVKMLRYPITVEADCPECHLGLKLCFCDSSLVDSCESPSAYSIEVATISWTTASCFLDEEHTRDTCTRKGDHLVCQPLAAGKAAPWHEEPSRGADPMNFAIPDFI